MPGPGYAQSALAAQLGRWLPDPVAVRAGRQLFRKSGIERRHCAIADFADETSEELFSRDATGRPLEPGTGARNRCFIRHATPLVVEAARAALAGSSGFGPQDVTHVVTVSCTGFYNPGPDLQVVQQLGLNDAVERYHLGFMGCYAAFPALRMAAQFCAARPDAVVLVVCVELCSLHMHPTADADSLLANTLFADGAAAALVSARAPAPGHPALSLDQFLSALAPEGGRDMAWHIGDDGFNIVLSSYVPDLLATKVGPIVERLLTRAGLRLNDIDLWAVHPGGRAILDKVESALGLQPSQIAAARDTLRDYGNMSSATVLFVLKRLLEDSGHEPQRICAMAFGPGLTVETAILTRRVETP